METDQQRGITPEEGTHNWTRKVSLHVDAGKYASVKLSQWKEELETQFLYII